MCDAFSQEQVYIGSQNSLWRLLEIPVALQIKQLMMKKEFELALRLAVSHLTFIRFLKFYFHL